MICKSNRASKNASTHQCRGHLFGHGKYSPLSHLTGRIHLFLKTRGKVIFTHRTWRTHYFTATQHTVFCFNTLLRLKQTYLSASPQEAEQVPVLQLFHHCDQGSPKWDHAEELRQEGMRSQLGQEGCKAQEVVPLCGISRVCTGGGENGNVTEANSLGAVFSMRILLLIFIFLYHLGRAAPHFCFPYELCRGTQRSRSAGRRRWAEGWPGWTTRAVSDEATLWAGR